MADTVLEEKDIDLHDHKHPDRLVNNSAVHKVNIVDRHLLAVVVNIVVDQEEEDHPEEHDY